jgi:flagellar motility protein MotE (MotC chaperone)
MIRFIRELRLLPIALIASACLLALKTADLMLGQGYFVESDTAPVADAESVIRTTPDVMQQSGSALSWARQMFNFPDGRSTASAPDVAPPPVDTADADITGSVTQTPASADKADKAGPSTKPATAAPAAPPAKDVKDFNTPGTVIPLEGPGQVSGAERAILERLQQRREELDARARELDIRQSLINEAEKRMDGKLAELKETEAKIAVETKQKDDAQSERLKGLVTMYENMKPRDAAKIFNGLDGTVLLEVASLINPRQMADILAQMSADTAEKLTVEIASKAQDVKPDSPATAELPKIIGQPTSQ